VGLVVGLLWTLSLGSLRIFTPHVLNNPNILAPELMSQGNDYAAWRAPKAVIFDVDFTGPQLLIIVLIHATVGNMQRSFPAHTVTQDSGWAQRNQKCSWG